PAAESEGGTVALAGSNTCAPLSARLDLKAPRSRGRIRTTPDHLSHRHRCQWQGRVLGSGTRTTSTRCATPSWRRTQVQKLLARLGSRFPLIVYDASFPGRITRLRFRTFQICAKDLRALPGHPEPAVSWHSGFRRGAHARHKTTPVSHAARRRGR